MFFCFCFCYLFFSFIFFNEFNSFFLNSSNAWFLCVLDCSVAIKIPIPEKASALTREEIEYLRNEINIMTYAAVQLASRQMTSELYQDEPSS